MLVPLLGQCLFIARKLKQCIGHLCPKQTVDVLFHSLEGKHPIPHVKVPFSCLSKSVEDNPGQACSWPPDSPETREALDLAKPGGAPLFAFLSARMIILQQLIHPLKYSWPDRELVYYATLYMDQHIPLILACEAVGFGRMKTLSDMYKFKNSPEFENLSLLRASHLLPEYVFPICEATLPKHLLSTQTLLFADSKSDALVHCFRKSNPQRCYSRDLSQTALGLIEAGDSRAIQLVLCSWLGNWPDCGFRPVLLARIRLLAGGVDKLLAYSKRMGPASSHAIREFVARCQLRPGPVEKVMTSVYAGYKPFFRNAQTVCKRVVRPHIQQSLFFRDREVKLQEDLTQWVKHASHSVSLPKPREEMHQILSRALERRFPSCSSSTDKAVPLSQEAKAMFVNLLESPHEYSEEDRKTALAALDDVSEKHVKSILQLANHTKRNLHKKQGLIFKPLSIEYWQHHKKAEVSPHFFCPKCFSVSFALPGVQAKPTNFPIMCKDGTHYTQVCHCEAGGVLVEEVDMRGYAVVKGKVTAIMCCSCFVITRLRDGCFNVGDKMFLCKKCARK